MKAIFMLLLISISLNSFSQEPLTFSEAIEVSGVNKDELFIRGREWFNENFKAQRTFYRLPIKKVGNYQEKE